MAPKNAPRLEDSAIAAALAAFCACRGFGRRPYVRCARGLSLGRSSGPSSPFRDRGLKLRATSMRRQRRGGHALRARPTRAAAICSARPARATRNRDRARRQASAPSPRRQRPFEVAARPRARRAGRDDRSTDTRRRCRPWRGSSLVGFVASRQARGRAQRSGRRSRFLRSSPRSGISAAPTCRPLGKLRHLFGPERRGPDGPRARSLAPPRRRPRAQPSPHGW